MRTCKRHGWASRNVVLLLGIVVCFGTAVPAASADDEPLQQVDRRQYEQMVGRALTYLQEQGQDESGAFSPHVGPAITALVATAFMRHGRSPEDPVVAEALNYLEGFVQPDGGIYAEGSFYRNYETCVALVCFQQANEDGRYDQVIAGGSEFIKVLQWNEGEDVDINSFFFGGSGYGKHGRPDMSNTSYFMDTLNELGEDADSEAIQNALTFVLRCQNFESPQNPSPFAALNPDGGFYYTIAAGGQSQAGETPEGGLRSYGSMSYAGLKSMIFAGLEPDDPRVEAVLEWISKNYNLTTNPGMGDAGLYYYYHTLAKALDAAGIDRVREPDDTVHAWRAELVEELARRQQPNGSWVNDNERWLENDPNLVTAYTLLALAYCRPDGEEAESP